MTRDEPAFLGEPDNYMLGVFEEHERADEAMRDLTERGFGEDQLLLCVPPESLDSTGSEHGVLASVERAVEHLLTDKSHLREYEEAAERGACVVGVHAATDEQKEQAQDVFQRHEASRINYFGKWTVETLNGGPGRSA